MSVFQPLLLRSIVRSRPIIESTISDKSAAAFQFSSRIFEFHYVYNNRLKQRQEKTFPILLTKMGPKIGISLSFHRIQIHAYACIYFRFSVSHDGFHIWAKPFFFILGRADDSIQLCYEQRDSF